MIFHLTTLISHSHYKYLKRKKIYYRLNHPLHCIGNWQFWFWLGWSGAFWCKAFDPRKVLIIKTFLNLNTFGLNSVNLVFVTDKETFTKMLAWYKTVWWRRWWGKESENGLILILSLICTFNLRKALHGWLEFNLM